MHCGNSYATAQLKQAPVKCERSLIASHSHPGSSIFSNKLAMLSIECKIFKIFNFEFPTTQAVIAVSHWLYTLTEPRRKDRKVMEMTSADGERL